MQVVQEGRPWSGGLCIRCGAGCAGRGVAFRPVDILPCQLVVKTLPEKEGEMPRERKELWPKGRGGVGIRMFPWEDFFKEL